MNLPGLIDLELFIENHQALLATLGGLSALIFIVSLFSLPWLACRIPADYFTHRERHPTAWRWEHPVLRILLLLGKNLLGLILLVGGFIMLFIPGQGLLTIAMGMLLLDYPGKYQLEKKLIGRPVILRSLNWLRGKRHHPPLQVDDYNGNEEGGER